jgi:hypothetical protein
MPHHLVCRDALLRIYHQRNGQEPLVNRQVRIVKDRARRSGKLMLAFEALVQMAGRNDLGFDLSRLRVLSIPRAFLRAELRNALGSTLDALNTFRPAHRFEVFQAGFLGRESFCNVYQSHSGHH